MNARQQTVKATRRQRTVGGRRGNTIVLVTGILVLLVIIATAFVVRTQAGRTTATATSNTGLREDNANMIADNLADELGAASLFVRGIDFTSLGLPLDLRVGSNAPRYPMSPLAIKFLGDEQNNDGNARPDYPFNTPPHAVVPFTNWPDPGTTLDNWGAIALGTWPGGNGANTDWPAGNGNPTAVIPVGSPLLGEFNPLGNPGFGDTRWLRDNEPQRWDTNNDGILDAFSHWRHMTNIARADNGWRPVFDISDVGDSNGDGYGRLVTDLNVPFEQFLAIPHNYLNPGNGDTNLATLGLQNFIDNWGNWMGVSPAGLGGYIAAYRDPALIPPNLLRLRDLDADGNYLEVGERPQDEFAGPGMLNGFPVGAPRWFANRILADADGDGYTDSFWFLAPSPVQSGVRTLVAISVVDNQGMLNANVATRYIRNDTTGIPRKTAGHTPVDIAIVGQGVAPANGNFNVGFYDNWESWLTIAPEIDTRYDTNLTAAGNLWFRHLTEVGLTNAANVPLDFPDVATRLDYWRRSASRPLSADPFAKYTPFSLSDELELRMYAGQNYPWIASRYEFSQGNNINGNGIGPMRANLPREESSEFIDQLVNFNLAVDLRHRTTLYNGVRNDIAPQWLWMYGPNKDSNGDTFVNALDRDLDGDGIQGDLDDVRLFQAGASKFDLRLPYHDPANNVFAFVDGEFNGAPGYEFTTNTSALQFGIALRDRLANALFDNFDNLPSNRRTYYGNSPADINLTQELAAAYAANVAQWRDRENFPIADLTSHEVSRLNEAVPVKASPTVAAPTTRFMGMEPQPFIVEAFVGHVYSDQYGPIPPLDAAGNPYTNAGQHVVNEDDATRSTIIAVQIANPYNRPINLDDPNATFQVRVFGQEFDLAGLGTLAPASEDQPATLVLYAIKDNIIGTGAPDTLEAKWLDFFDLSTATNLCPNSMVVRVDTSRWDIDSRGTYDSSSEPAVEIRRRDPVTGQWVTIDRMDSTTDERFGDAISSLSATAPAPAAPLPPATWIHGDPAGQPYPGLSIGVDGSGYDHWVQWVRATRAWGVDVNNDGEIDPNEVNPRFVFGDYAVSTAFGDPADIDDPADLNTFLNGGDRYKFTTSPDGPWFTRPYMREDPTTPGTDLLTKRKPTFFDFNHITGADPAFPNWSFPDKGWYAQKGTGSVDDSVLDTSTTPPTRNYLTPFAFQMLHKDNDFEQVGELLNVFLYGHKLQFTDNTPTGTFTGVTVTTFSEYLSDANSALTGSQDPNIRFRTNRLLLAPSSIGGTLGQVVGVGDPLAIDDPRHAMPDLPAGVRIFDAFVCDSFGCAPLIDFNSSGSTADEAEARTLYNAKNFDGSSTPGMINLSTASPEVIRAMPMMMRLVHETGGTSPGTPFYNNLGQPLVTTAPNPAAMLPRVMLPEAIRQYGERFNGDVLPTPNPTGMPYAPNYSQRSNPRGFQSIGELLLLNQPGRYVPGYVDRNASNAVDRIYNEQWRMDFDIASQSLQVGSVIGVKPFFDQAGGAGDQISMQVSTDRQGVWDPFAGVPGTPRVDYVAGDAEEANALFAGISNLVTTRSDVFTVYFKVRSFRQNTSVNPPRWDATNQEYIVDDSRYVMLVDRSGVNKPGDSPKILYLEKLPN